MSDRRGRFDDEPADGAIGGVPATAPDDASDDAGEDRVDAVDPDEVHARSRAAALADGVGHAERPHGVPGSDGGGDDADGRPVPLRLAHLHLRMGSLALARAELESLAGRGMLDEPALVDLAEVRWRTGDLAGAGEAANALLTRGRSDVLALVIAAESVSAQGRPGEARRLAARALESHPTSLEPLFAGIPRSLIWPAEAAIDDLPVDAPGEPLAARVPQRTAAGRGAGSAAAVPASTGAAEAYAGGRAALLAGDMVQAAVRLGVAVRLEPGYAPDVLAVIGEAPTDPALALVAGDALRLLGRESDALEAFDIARGHVHSPEEPHLRDRAPGEDGSSR